MNLILLLVSDIDDNFWFLTGHRTEKVVIINFTSFVTTQHLIQGWEVHLIVGTEMLSQS